MDTLDTLVKTHGIDVLDHLDKDMLVPIISDQAQVQGDVIFLPIRAGHESTVGDAVPSNGYPLVRGESGGNTHMLVAEGPVCFKPGANLDDETNLVLGVITVPQGAVAYSAHPEHGFLGLGPNTWMAKRQREQADEIRRVAD